MDAVKLLVFVAVYFQGCFSTERKKSFSPCKDASKGSLYDYTMNDIHGVKLDEKFYKNQVTLVMNVATFWGLTMQYLQLNELLEKYNKDKDDDAKCSFKVLAVPCNQFGLQEPGENAYEILNGLKYVRPGHGFTLNHDIKLLEKTEVNGKNENKMFSFLKVININEIYNMISWTVE